MIPGSVEAQNDGSSVWSVLEAKVAIFQAEKNNKSKWTYMETNGVVEICLAVLDSFLQINGFRNECFTFPPKPLLAPTGNPTVWARALEVISLSFPTSQLRYFCLTNFNSMSFSPREHPWPQLKWSLRQTSPIRVSVPRMVLLYHLHDNMLIKTFSFQKCCKTYYIIRDNVLWKYVHV